ncbi:MAG TPA: pitrilysin family protein [Thermoanaerobaculia bacterium]|nr:pitrilysin family protein [Thermoanaerobaculia bacterium]
MALPLRALPLCALALAAGLPPSMPALAQVAPPVERPEDLVFPPLPDFELPSPRRVELGNGMVVMLLEDHELPLVQAVALVRAGGRLEPAEKVGLARVAGSVARTGGTERMSPDELDDFLEGKAAVVESSAGEAQTRVSMSALAEDFAEVLRVFADVLRRPAFSPDRIEVALTQERSGVARQNDSPQSILFRELDEQVYGPDSPYARTPTYATLAAIDREDLVSWHRRHFRPEQVILGLVGDFDSETALALVREAFGDWQAPSGGEQADTEELGAAAGTAGLYREEPSPGVFVAEKGDVNQSSIALGHLGILKSHPDFYAVEVMNEVFGGSMTSRLFSEVRTRKGLAYAVSGRVGSEWDFPGVTLVFTTTKVETTGQAIRALLDEARGMAARPPSDDEVERAKRAILNSFVFRIDSPRGVLEQQLTFEYFGYPLDWLSSYRDRIEAVTAEEVRQAASRHLHPDAFSIVVVGPAEGRDEDLGGFGPVRQLDISIPGPPAP